MYILPVINACDDINEFSVSIAPSAGGPETQVPCYDVFGEEDFSASKVHYVVINTLSTNEQYIRIGIVRNNETDGKKETITLGNMFKCTKSDICKKYNPEADLRKFDYNNEFNYTYQPDKNVVIDNPLSSESFTHSEHIYNPFTISQIGYTSYKIVG